MNEKTTAELAAVELLVENKRLEAEIAALHARAEAAEAKLAAGQVGRARIGTCECNKSHKCCFDEWEASEAKLAEVERRLDGCEASLEAAILRGDQAEGERAAAESREKALRERVEDREELLAQLLQAHDEEDERSYQAVIRAALAALAAGKEDA